MAQKSPSPQGFILDVYLLELPTRKTLYAAETLRHAYRLAATLYAAEALRHAYRLAANLYVTKTLRHVYRLSATLYAAEALSDMPLDWQLPGSQ